MAQTLGGPTGAVKALFAPAASARGHRRWLARGGSGLWIAAHEGATFRLAAMAEPRNRGVRAWRAELCRRHGISENAP